MGQLRTFCKGLPAIILMLLFTIDSPAQFTRGVQMNFGKNRVQYNDFLWTFYRFKNFDTYYYLGGQELAIYTGRTADNDIAEIEKLFDYRINGRFQFIIYNRLSDLKQSNIGLEGEEQNNNTGGLTRIIGNKVLIYFDGDYRHFRQQIRAGVAQVMIQQLMYGGSIRDRVQSSVLLHLPDWYLQGLIRYIANGWTPEEDGEIRDAILNNRYRNFNNLTGFDAIFAGSSLWHFIHEKFGPGSISNLLYMTRVNRNIESGFSYVLGLNMKQLGKEWLNYFKEIVEKDTLNRESLPGDVLLTIKKKKGIVNQVSLSPDGSRIAYVTNDAGKYRIWLYDIARNKKKKIGKGGYRSVQQDLDISYPALAWHPSGNFLASIKEKKGKLWLDYYMAGKKFKRETNKFFYFEKVLDFSFSGGGSEMVLSAVQKGQSDIFTFNPRTKTYQQLTKDRWDDAHPRFVLDDRYIVFSSTRYEDSLRNTYMRQSSELVLPQTSDIFLMDYYNKSEKLIRITNTPGANETQPIETGPSQFSYLSDENGIINCYSASLDSTIAYIDTVIHYRYIIQSSPQSDFALNILEQDFSMSKTKNATLVKNNQNFQIRTEIIATKGNNDIKPLRKTSRKYTFGESNKNNRPKQDNKSGIIIIEQQSDQGKSIEKRDSLKVDIKNYIFQSDFESSREKRDSTSEKKRTVSSANASEAGDDTLSSYEKTLQGLNDSTYYQLPKQRNYETAFAPSYVLTQLDNNLLNETYQTYTGGAVYFSPGLNALFKIGINDLLDDYRFIGGMRLSGNLNSNEYYVSFENLRQRLDKQISFYRQAREEFTTASYIKVHTHELKYAVKWPFSDITSIRAMAAYRHDRLVSLSTDQFNLLLPNQYENRISSRVEFVYDNTISKGLNLYNGVRFKLFTELFKQTDISNSLLNVWGADFRHYLKLHRQIIWANRFATSTSLGSQKLIYYLGSTDNAFTPTNNFNDNIQVDPTQNYSFQALATNMRGFIQNIRNGNSFALINSEVRIPVFQYLINRPIRSDFIRNFQIIGFGDIGTAWTGPSPYSKTNALFRKEYPGNPISITVTKDIEPIVGGFGFGLRSRVLGYFLRADWSWGVDDGEIQERIFYFSLGLDF